MQAKVALRAALFKPRTHGATSRSHAFARQRHALCKQGLKPCRDRLLVVRDDLLRALVRPGRRGGGHDLIKFL
jgi:hypothetical protein